MSNDGSVDCKKTHSLGAKSHTSPAGARLRLFLHYRYDLFFMRRDGLSILKACSFIFYLRCAFGSHVPWNSAVPDPNMWCFIVLFLCTLDAMTDVMHTAPIAYLFMQKAPIASLFIKGQVAV